MSSTVMTRFVSFMISTPQLCFEYKEKNKTAYYHKFSLNCLKYMDIIFDHMVFDLMYHCFILFLDITDLVIQTYLH